MVRGAAKEVEEALWQIETDSSQAARAATVYMTDVSYLASTAGLASAAAIPLVICGLSVPPLPYSKVVSSIVGGTVIGIAVAICIVRRFSQNVST